MIDPVLFKLGSFEIRYYGLLFALAFLIGYYLAKKLSKEFNIEESKIENISIYLLISIIIGARLIALGSSTFETAKYFTFGKVV